jgi:hypothetical protein
MDKVTQQNAANAEESASASEELSAQAEPGLSPDRPPQTGRRKTGQNRRQGNPLRQRRFFRFLRHPIPVSDGIQDAEDSLLRPFFKVSTVFWTL